jgi:hypothetical protein
VVAKQSSQLGTNENEANFLGDKGEAVTNCAHNIHQTLNPIRRGWIQKSELLYVTANEWEDANEANKEEANMILFVGIQC